MGGVVGGRWRVEGGAWEDNKPSRRMGRRGPRVARDGGGMMMAVGQREIHHCLLRRIRRPSRQQALVEQRALSCRH